MPSAHRSFRRFLLEAVRKANEETDKIEKILAVALVLSLVLDKFLDISEFTPAPII